MEEDVLEDIVEENNTKDINESGASEKGQKTSE